MTILFEKSAIDLYNFAKSEVSEIRIHSQSSELWL